MKRMVVMQDLSCLWKCSLTVIHPVISAMGISCAVLPTAVLSTHTAFPSPTVTALDDFANRALDHCATLDPDFGGILTGYLANPQQIILAEKLIDGFGKDAVIVTDPAMADHGKLYGGLTPDMIPAMARLCGRASLVLPNLTEAALMTDMDFRNTADLGYCQELGAELLKLGCKSVMLTGAEHKPGEIGFYWPDGREESSYGTQKLARSCHGTGDLLAAVVTGGLMRGMSSGRAGELACEFVRRSIAATPEDSRYGVAFEGELGWLISRL